MKLSYYREEPITRIDLTITDIAQIALCIPDGCYPSEIFSELGIDSYCVTSEPASLDAGDIACM